MSQSKERVWIYFYLCPSGDKQRKAILIRPGWMIYNKLSYLLTESIRESEFSH